MSRGPNCINQRWLNRNSVANSISGDSEVRELKSPFTLTFLEQSTPPLPLRLCR